MFFPFINYEFFLVCEIDLIEFSYFQIFLIQLLYEMNTEYYREHKKYQKLIIKTIFNETKKNEYEIFFFFFDEKYEGKKTVNNKQKQ